MTQLSCRFPGASAGERLHDIAIERLGPLPFYYPRAALSCARRTQLGEFDVVVDCLNKVPFLSPLYASAPVLALSHHLFGETAFQQVAWPVAAGLWCVERLIPLAYRGAPFIAISESSRDDLVERGVPGEHVTVSLCGIDHPVGRETPLVPRSARIGYLGRLEAYKRVDVFLRAAAVLRQSCPELEVLVIGRGTAEESLRELAEELHLADCIRFTGFVSDEERDDLLSSCRVCVCPSEKEGWGLTVIEANAHGTPVVASDAPGLRESVRHGETGLLVPIGDDKACAEAIASLLEDDARWLRFAQAARAWSERFDWDLTADDFEASLRSACAQRRGLPPASDPTQLGGGDA